MSIQRKSTEKMELVETHNLALSLKRLNNAVPWSSEGWKRSLVHALAIAGCASWEERRLIREALKQP